MIAVIGVILTWLSAGILATVLLVLIARMKSDVQSRRDYAEDIEWSIAAAQSYSRTGRYGNVSLQQEGEAWRSTLCHGPDDCRN